MTAVLFTACLEAFQAQAGLIPNDVEFPGLDWEGWQAIADTLGISGMVDAPIFRTRQAVKIAVAADAANLSGDRVKFSAVEERLCDILSGGASTSQVPDTQAEELLLQPARARVVLRERRKRGRHAVTSYYLVFDNHPQAEGAWVTQGELRRHFPAAWQPMIAEYNQRRAAGTLLEPSPSDSDEAGPAPPQALQGTQPASRGGRPEQAEAVEHQRPQALPGQRVVFGTGRGRLLPPLGAAHGVALPRGMPVAPRSIPLESQPEEEPPPLYANQGHGRPLPPSLLLAGMAPAPVVPPRSLQAAAAPSQLGQPAAHGSGLRAEQAAGRAFFVQQQQQRQLAVAQVSAPPRPPTARQPGSMPLLRAQAGAAPAAAPQPPPGYNRAAPLPTPPPTFSSAEAGGQPGSAHPRLQQPSGVGGAGKAPGRPLPRPVFFGGGGHAPSAGSDRSPSGQTIVAAYRRRPAAQLVPPAAVLGPPRPPPGYKQAAQQQADGAEPSAARRPAAPDGEATSELLQRAAKRTRRGETAPAAHVVAPPATTTAAAAAADAALQEAARAAAHRREAPAVAASDGDEAELAFLQARALPLLAARWQDGEPAPRGAAAGQAATGEDDFFDAQEELQQESSVAPGGAVPPPLQLLPRTQPDEVQFANLEEAQGLGEVGAGARRHRQGGQQGGGGSVVVPDTEAEVAGQDPAQAQAQQRQRQRARRTGEPPASGGVRGELLEAEQERRAGPEEEEEEEGEGEMEADAGAEEDGEDSDDELAALAGRLSEATIRGAKVTANGVEISVQWPDGVRESILSSVIHGLARDGCPGCCALSKLSQFYESKVRDSGTRPKKKR